MPTDFSKLTDEQKEKWASMPMPQCGIDDKPNDYVEKLLAELDHNVFQDEPVNETEFLIDAIVGIGFGGSMEFADKCTKWGFAKFTGNQHNEEWSWDADVLKQQRNDVLLILYKSLQINCRKQHGH